MKFNFINEVIPQDKRKEINDKVLFLIEKELCNKYGLTKEDIYNSYTGDGGLHGLNAKEFNSYHDFSEAKKEIEQGQFFTSHHIAKYLVDILQPTQYDVIADLTCGSGVFFNFLPNESNIYGNEIDVKAHKVASYLYQNSNLTLGDIRNYSPKVKFDLVIGNPPFNLKWGKELSQMTYLKKSYELLRTAGLLAIVVPNSFLADEFFNKSDIEYVNRHFNFVCQIALDKNSFKHLGVINFDTKILILQKSSLYIQDTPYSLEFAEGTAEEIHEKYIVPLNKVKQSQKNHIFYENVRNREYLEQDFLFKVNKLLFDIKRTKNTNSKYSECKAYLEEYLNQEKPEYIKYDEWDKVRIKKEAVLDKCAAVLRNQHIKEVDKIELVKTNYQLKLKAYSEKTLNELRSSENPICRSINDTVINNYVFDDKKYLKLVDRKKNEYLRQSVLFKDMDTNADIEKWLKTTCLHDSENDMDIYLNAEQLKDTNKFLQKRYGYVQWEQGGGKTITGIFQALYRLSHNNIKNVFVVGPAIAIKNTWDTMLENFGIDHIVINSLEDINNIKSGQMVLLTFGMIVKYQRFIKKYLKVNNKKFMLILDEADGISNIYSQRAKALKNCFRRLPYKLFLSGTSTRNSINEAFSQFELLYNNSINMLSTNATIYETDKSGDLGEHNNPFFNQPFPAYKQGFDLFTSSHIPKKITVFGISKFNQDIYNADELKELIDKTFITRTLEEIAGRKLYDIHQKVCNFNDAEAALYEKILREFYSMSEQYHIKTGNDRKDSMFKILAQLNTLLKSCSIAHSFDEYTGTGVSSKFKTVFTLLRKFSDERVAIGCTRVKTVNLYAEEIRKKFPDRPLFIITGNTTTLKQRRELVEELKKHPNAILLSTQQSLSCSMNINFIDQVIIPEMQWNDSACAQYRGRFIRLNSANSTNIYNVIYDKSIETNLLKLIMSKEKLNLFMKNQDLENDEIYEKYGIDSYIFEVLMEKVKDEKGNVQITWGKQQINTSNKVHNTWEKKQVSNEVPKQHIQMSFADLLVG